MSTQMEKRIEQELKGKKPQEIQDLLLDNCKATSISGLTEEFTNLTTLTFINVGLTSLDGLPKLPSLRTIDLSDNKLTGGFDHLVACCPRLYHINLCANKITEIESLTPFKSLEELTALDLFDCQVTELPEYRTKVFALIPHLKYLDGFDQNDIEADLSEEEDIGDEEDSLDEDGDEEGSLEGEGDEEESIDEEAFDSNDEEALAYLNSSKALQDEDESEDYGEKAVQNGSEKKNGEKVATKTTQLNADQNNKKRKLEVSNDAAKVDGEPDAKI